MIFDIVCKMTVPAVMYYLHGVSQCVQCFLNKTQHNSQNVGLKN